MDQIVGKRSRKIVSKADLPDTKTVSLPGPEGVATGDTSELGHRTALALFTLGKPGAFEAVERRQVAELLVHYHALVFGEGPQPPVDLARLRFSEFGMELFTELVALMRLQDSHIAELQATLSELI